MPNRGMGTGDRRLEDGQKRELRNRRHPTERLPIGQTSNPVSLEKVAHQPCNFLMVRLEREVAGVQKMDLSVRHVTPVSLRAGRNEERVIFPPNRENGRLSLTKIALKLS